MRMMRAVVGSGTIMGGETDQLKEAVHVRR